VIDIVINEVDVEVIQVVRAVYIRGDGHNTIMRRVTGYFSLDGTALAEHDPCHNNDKVPS
jgi:hypothetical protein